MPIELLLAHRQHHHGAPPGPHSPRRCHLYIAERCHLYIALTSVREPFSRKGEYGSHRPRGREIFLDRISTWLRSATAAIAACPRSSSTRSGSISALL